MADELGVMIEAPEVEETEQVDTETSSDALPESTESTEVETTPEAKSDDPYTTKFSREMRAELKKWESEHPEAAKYAKQARDNHARLYALNQIEPKGIDGVREKYALLEGLSHGESRGAEALAAIQEELQGVQETDELLASGDPRAFEALGDAFNDGLAKLAPAYLDRISKSDPESLNRAVMPYLVSTLQQSELVKHYNDLVDVLNAQNDPRFNDQTKMQFTIQSLAKMGQWLNGLQEKAITSPQGPNKEQEQFQTERSKFEKEREDYHWNTKIFPETKKSAAQAFQRLFGPYQSRLKLPPVALQNAEREFRDQLQKQGDADKNYVKQVNIYRNQKAADPKTVINHFNAGTARHAKAAFDAMMEARGYTAFLAGRPKTPAPVEAKGNGKVTPTIPNMEVRTVKPRDEEIDHQRRTIEQIRTKVFPLKTGKLVQWKPV